MPGFLDQLGHLYGTDKASGSHDYLDWYEFYLYQMRYNPIRLLEIGIGEGPSLKMWRDYFQFGTIVGMDIDPEKRRHCEGPRMFFCYGDQGNLVDLKVVAESGPFDVIVDDGGHNPDAQILSYRRLLPTLNIGGIYILEDIGDQRVTEFLGKIMDGVVRGQNLELGCHIESVAFMRESSITKIGKPR